VTANQDQIQRLLSEVQDVLAQRSPRLPWGSAAQIARQRQVLKQVRAHLEVALLHLNQADQTTKTEAQAQDVMQSVIQEMNALRSTLLHPLHAEVATLMQQRNALTKEIRQLEAHRQMLEQPTPTETVSQPGLPGVNQADQALTSLDTTLHVVFESLQKDIQAYQDSLSQGIDKLHSLGQQSEAMFSGIVGRLAAQMGRDASTFLQASSELSTSPEAFRMPYAGSEFVPTRIESARSASLETITVLTQLIDQLEVEVDEFPLSIPATPPRDGISSGKDIPSDLKSLFQTDSPKVEPTIDAMAYSELNQETTLDQLNPSVSSSSQGSSIAEEPIIFTLEGIEDLFLEESKNQPNG
jgi:hypothetical protein